MKEITRMDPEKAAEMLEGKCLQIGRRKVTITTTLARSREDNGRWIETKPLFGRDPVGAYVSLYRGAALLFIRTAPNTCVRIDGAVAGDERLGKPGQVTKHFGIAEEKTGDVAFDGTTLSISWHRRPRTIIL